MLKEIDALLCQNGKTLHDFNTLPIPDELPAIDVSNHLILQELSYNRGDSIDDVADIEIPKEVLMANCHDPLNAIVQATYEDLLDNLTLNEYFNDREILAPTINGR
ncbi:hypothetical protein K1719_009773 [Acacia pycnantha]|nr:hypothetical protein K1719_009773 [Acacia pycnantha]